MKHHKNPAALPPSLRLFFVLVSGLVGGVLLLAAGAVGAAAYCNAPPASRTAAEFPGIQTGESGAVLFEVREGESAYNVGMRLEQAGLIRTRYFWNILARLDREYLKAGTYRLALPASQTDIRAALVEGKQILIRVTIPEGVTLKKAAVILEEAGICGAEEFLAAASDRAITESFSIPNDTMEGYLYPETYFFPAPYPADRVVKTLADTFFDRVAEIAPESKKLSPQELNEVIILASIVEREYRVSDEASIMAGVFYNRLEKPMPLESCATVEYIITEIQGKPHPRVLYYADIEISHPYNTYVIPGLPPGPISLPGKTALNAAFHPADTDYLFFRLVDEAAGRHYFSRTLDDHIKAGALFVKGSS
ncbi:MAG: endolytic transglycosylase MltG [Spirochaetaceae bacterium]|nr:endolytic transglycosylase MltG [Spirochaetaceae bacterium]